MTKQILILVLCIFGQTTFGQGKADSLFSRGGKLYEQKDFLGAINCFKEVALNFKSFKYHNQCVYNLAYTYDNIDSTEQAIYWFEKIRASDVKDNERVGGRGIFEPYSNYKHYSTFHIANIEYNKGNYEKALDYYRQCFTKYPYYNESGTDIRINKNNVTIYIVDCLLGLKLYDEALTTIVPLVLESYRSNNHKSVTKKALTLIETNYDKKKIADELEVAFKTMKQKQNNYQFEFIWRAKTIELFPYLADKGLTVESFITKIKQTDFWVELTN
jgi:tetratricopeptide (TPR) repeat protein